MTERDYILASDLGRVRAMLAIAAQLVSCDQEDLFKRHQLEQILASWAMDLEEAIKPEDD